ncbi:MAG: pantoate--beta-alanine ligase [Phycisphaerales bacterium]|nr:pantoate--beta-alanine ligase [Phycisphaerales bacterium]
MEVARDIASLQKAVGEARAGGLRVGLVPTMGALHAGHLSLVSEALRATEYVVVSIFVNPTQFGPSEDFDAYPRPEESDLAACNDVGVDLVFAPSVDQVYPGAIATTIHVAGLSDTLCGPHRPGHFDGVATVVAKLFNLVRPDVAFFGRKDAQQLAIIRRMGADLNFPVAVEGCPTVREADGLALSSRNAYLSTDERARAIALHDALAAARDRIRAGTRNAAPLVREMASIVQKSRPTAVDYISAVDPDSLRPIDTIEGPVLLALAVRYGKTRLIDNVLVDPTERG